MDDLLSVPARAYHHIETQYGTIGLMVAGLMIAVGVVSVLIWIDRRK
jgi:hypothetical protein